LFVCLSDVKIVKSFVSLCLLVSRHCPSLAPVLLKYKQREKNNKIKPKRVVFALVFKSHIRAVCQKYLAKNRRFGLGLLLGPFFDNKPSIIKKI